MVCRSCGATIAEKAIVCYRCGTPTAADPASLRPRAPAPRRRRARLVLAAVVAAIAALAALAAWLIPGG
jgi:hypothetical protein